MDISRAEKIGDVLDVVNNRVLQPVCVGIGTGVAFSVLGFTTPLWIGGAAIVLGGYYKYLNNKDKKFKDFLEKEVDL